MGRIGHSRSSSRDDQNKAEKSNVQPLTIYFDGVCNLCSGAVQFILRRDKKVRFRFASLQGHSGQAFLSANQFSREHFDTFILQEGEKIYTKSTAALRVSKYLTGLWPLLYLFIIVPRFIRDAVYGFISGKRYAWFGKRDACWMPEQKWMNRFLP
jgi:predicted DCC family thiol-disulfide oxidoreductase YuxK